MDLKTRLAIILASFAIATIFLAFGAASVAFTMNQTESPQF